MRPFRKSSPAARVDWLVEVEYEAGWFAYGPPLPDRYAAEALSHDLRRRGRNTRIRALDAAPAAPPPDTQHEHKGKSKNQAAQRPRRRHGRPR